MEFRRPPSPSLSPSRKPIKTKQGDEEEQQPETLPITEESRPSSAPEHHRSAYNINTIDEKKDYIESHKYLKTAHAKC